MNPNLDISPFDQGVMAANRSLDCASFSAPELRTAWEKARDRYEREENRDMQAYAEGYVHVLDDFIHSRSDR